MKCPHCGAECRCPAPAAQLHQGEATIRCQEPAAPKTKRPSELERLFVCVKRLK